MRSVEHTCHAPYCETEIPPHLHMCKRHWLLLPERLRKLIWSTYRKGQEIDKRPSAAYMQAVELTRAYIMKIEGTTDGPAAR